MGRLSLQQILHALQDGGDAALVVAAQGGDAALVVAAQGGGAVGADDAALNDGVDVAAGLDLIRVGHEADGIAGQGAGDVGHQVFAVAAVGLAGLVDAVGDAALREVALQPLHHGQLPFGGAEHLDHLQETALQTLLRDHITSPRSRHPPAPSCR